MINEEAINRASERFGYFPNGFTSYRETLADLSIKIGHCLFFEDTPEALGINKYRDQVGSIGLLDLAHSWAVEFEEKWKGTEWGVDDGPDWIETIDEFFNEKAKSLTV